ncbi:hypothetical protein ACFE04_020491 [Oxalis oulophora]
MGLGGLKSPKSTRVKLSADLKAYPTKFKDDMSFQDTIGEDRGIPMARHPILAPPPIKNQQRKHMDVSSPMRHLLAPPPRGAPTSFSWELHIIGLGSSQDSKLGRGLLRRSSVGRPSLSPYTKTLTSNQR